MNKLIKLRKDQTHNIAFLSDLHLGHDKEFLWGKRGFLNSTCHDEWIYRLWHEQFDENTIIFNLGDACFNDPKGERFDLVSKLPCKEHYLLWGNHNSGALSTYKKRVNEFLGVDGIQPNNQPEVYPIKHNNITFVGNDLTVRVGKQEITLSHFPKRIWDHIGWGAWHLSGHSHGSDSERQVNSKNGRCLDVGVENANIYDDLFFFSYADIKRIMDEKCISKHDHHDETIAPSR